MRSRLLAAALAAALALAACGDGGNSDAVGTATPEAAGGSDEVTTEDTLPAGDGLLDFEAATVSGTTVDLRQYEGADLLVWFWAPW